MSKTAKQYKYEPLFDKFPKPSFHKTLENSVNMVAMVAFTHDTNNRNIKLVDSSNSVFVKSEAEKGSSYYELEGCPSYAICAADTGKVIVVDLREDSKYTQTVELGSSVVNADLYALEISSDDKFLVCGGNSNNLYKISLHFDDGFKLNAEKITYQTINKVISGDDIFSISFRPTSFLLSQNSDAGQYIVAVAGGGKKGDDKKLCLVDVEAGAKICCINTIPLGKESTAADQDGVDATFCCWNYSGELLGCCLENGTTIICEVNETPKYKSQIASDNSATSSSPLSKYFDIQTHFIDKFKAPCKEHDTPTYSWCCQFSSTSFICCAGELVRIYIKNNDFNSNSCIDDETGFDSFFVKSFDIDLSAQGLYGEIACSSESTVRTPQTIYGLSMLNSHTFVTCSESGMMHIVDLSLCEREKHKILQKKQHNQKLTKAEEVFEINRVVAATTDRISQVAEFRISSCKNCFAVSSFDGNLYVYKNFTVSWKWMNSVKDVFLVSERSNTRMKLALEQWKTLRNIVSFC